MNDNEIRAWYRLYAKGFMMGANNVWHSKYDPKFSKEVDFMEQEQKIEEMYEHEVVKNIELQKKIKELENEINILNANEIKSRDEFKTIKQGFADSKDEIYNLKKTIFKKDNKIVHYKNKAEYLERKVVGLNQRILNLEVKLGHRNDSMCGDVREVDIRKVIKEKV